MQPKESSVNKREHVRSRLQATVSISETPIGDFKAKTADVSDGGIHATCDNAMGIPIGSHIKVQLLGLPVEAPVNTMEVVWHSEDGMGLKFVPSNSSESHSSESSQTPE